MRKVYVIVIIIQILLVRSSIAQSISIVQIEKQAKTAYTIKQENYKETKINFTSPEVGYSIINSKNKPLTYSFLKNRQYYWHKNFEQDLELKCDSAQIQIICYSKGIAEYDVYLKIGEDKFITKKIKVSQNGLQSPVVIVLNELSVFGDTLSPLPDNDKILNVEEIILSILPREKRFKFNVSELRILELFEYERETNNPFFDKITGNNSFENLNGNSINIESDYLLIGDYKDYGELESREFFVKVNQKEYDHKDVVLKFMSKVLEYYPFYEYTTVNKAKVLNTIARLQKSDISYQMCLDSLVDIINRYEDPHFFVLRRPWETKETKRTNKHKWINPLPFFEFHNQIYIAGVFDTTLQSIISPGDKVLKCTCYEGIDTIKDTTFIRTNSILSLKESCENIFIVTVNNKGDTLQTYFDYDYNNIHISSNFKPQNSDFKQIKDICYFKINRIDHDTYRHFIANKNSIKKSKGLVIDLRNCGGGNSSVASKIIAHFTSEPVIVKNTTITGIDSYKESVVVKPHGRKNLELPTTVLVNKRTACGAEYFSYLLKCHANAKLIGNSNTAGAMATIHDIVFPDGLIIRIDCLSKTEFYPKILVENIGLSPDIWVVNSKVEDLYPYNDKILETALLYLRACKHKKRLF